MNRIFKKIIVVALLSAIPLVIMIYNNFIRHGRGGHTLLIQYHSCFWLTRLLITPLLVITTIKLWEKATNSLKLFLYPAMTFFLYNSLCWVISFVSSRWLAVSYDGRDRNLFNTIRYESTFLNLLIFVITVLIVFTWLYFERQKMASAQTFELEKTLAEVKQHLVTIQTIAKEAPGNEKTNIIAVKTGYKTILVPVEEIICIQSNGPYVNIITETTSHLLKKTLSELEKILPVPFIRVHRSNIVNMEYVKEFKSLFNGDSLLVLKNGKEIRSSRTYKERILSVLSNDQRLV